MFVYVCQSTTTLVARRLLFDCGRVLFLANELTFGLLLVGLRLFLVFHSSILEPNLDLPFGESQIVRYLDAAPTSQVFVGVELFLELQGLKARVGLPASFPFNCVQSGRGDFGLWVVSMRPGGGESLPADASRLIGPRAEAGESCRGCRESEDHIG